MVIIRNNCLICQIFCLCDKSNHKFVYTGAPERSMPKRNQKLRATMFNVWPDKPILTIVGRAIFWILLGTDLITISQSLHICTYVLHSNIAFGFL